MSIYKRDIFDPEWEPAPYDLCARAADRQEQGFHERALKPIIWRKAPWKAFPTDGLFGQSREWFSHHGVTYVATLDGEDLILFQNDWYGWPDPPEWGLASRQIKDKDPKWRSWRKKWKYWGYVPRLPTAWIIPDERSS